MWLLHTRTLELKNFTNPKDVSYAALSHVWEATDHIHTFQDIKAIAARCAASTSGEDLRSLVTPKVRNFCIYAEREGYEWAWLDTCCIDKSSSAELSEAINSMFYWYRDAEVCHAYLFDVDDDDPRVPSSSFRRSRWHTRGWTLQELIAPRYVTFLSRTWHTIGTKVSLANLLADITGIDLDVLLQRFPECLHVRTSAARRMSWASKRETTRIEDRAYSLLGLFGIPMPIIYGEGSEAFQRLQKEILKREKDQSVFAWGPIHPSFDRAHEHIEWPNMKASNVYDKLRRFSTWEEPGEEYSLGFLLSPSPDYFANSAGFGPTPNIVKDSSYTFTDVDCTFTNAGVDMELLISCDSVRRKVGAHVYAAALACGDKSYVVILFP